MALGIGEHVVNGLLSGMEARGNAGWMRYSILEEGKQYPVKVDTRKPEIIAACQALMGQQVSAKINVQDSGNANPNQPGTNFLNRYLNEIGALSNGAFPQTAATNVAPPAQQQQAAQQATNVAQPQQQAANPFSPDARDLKIYRQVAWKTAVELAAAGKVPFSPMELVQAAEVAMAYLVYGPARFGVTAFDTAHAPGAPVPQAAAEEPPHPAEQAGQPPANFNAELVPCAQCGAEPGFEHAADCIPF